jgi:hypothetical protein
MVFVVLLVECFWCVYSIVGHCLVQSNHNKTHITVEQITSYNDTNNTTTNNKHPSPPNKCTRTRCVRRVVVLCRCAHTDTVDACKLLSNQFNPINFVVVTWRVEKVVVRGDNGQAMLTNRGGVGVG